MNISQFTTIYREKKQKIYPMRHINKRNIILNTLNIYGIIIEFVVDKEVVAI
jgi:hypothetical protein